MSDELRQYPATPRRLEKLRQAGDTPASTVVSAAVTLGAFTAFGALAGRPLCAALRAMLAQDLQRGLTGVPLAELFGRHLLLGGGLVTVLALLLALLAGMVSGLQSATPGRAPWRAPGLGRLKVDVPGIVLGLVAVAGTLLILVGFVRGNAEAGQWSALADPSRVGTPWLRELSLLGGLALLHLLWTRAQYLQRAMLTRRELRDEQRETEGSWLRRRLIRRESRGA